MLTRIFKVAATGVVALGLGVSPIYADEHETCGVDIENATPSGTITGSMKSIGFLVGARWGNGVLTLDNGGERDFHVVGGKVLETGVAKNDFIGEVYNLKHTDDFPGTFYGAATGITFGTLGKGEGIFNNARCVVVKLRTTGAGLKFSGPAPSAVEVSFVD